MIKDWLTKEKVDKKVKPIHFNKRQPVNLVLGKKYYVSFGKNIATNCTLTKFEKKDGYPTTITIEIPTKAKSKKGFFDLNRKISHNWVDTHNLFEDEIGLTPEQAVIHEVTL